MKEEIPLSEILNQSNNWLTTWLPIASVFIGIAVAITFIRFLSEAIIAAFKNDFDPDSKRKNDQLSEGESRKLKNDELPWIEDEKPKRTSHFELGDDGELVEVFSQHIDEG